MRTKESGRVAHGAGGGVPQRLRGAERMQVVVWGQGGMGGGVGGRHASVFEWRRVRAGEVAGGRGTE